MGWSMSDAIAAEAFIMYEYSGRHQEGVSEAIQSAITAHGPFAPLQITAMVRALATLAREPAIDNSGVGTGDITGFNVQLIFCSG